MRLISNLKPCMTIDKREIGARNPIFIVIETGITANGSLEIGKKLIEKSKESGADAVKFQTLDCDGFMADRNVIYKYETYEGIKEENMYEMLKGHQLSRSDLIELGKYAKKIGISYYLSVDTARSVKWAEDAGASAYKIGSWSLRNFPLLEAVAKSKKPIQIDLGPVVIGEIVQALEFLEKNGAEEVMLVYCSHAEEMKDLNLNSIPYLMDLLGIPIGYSADTRDQVPDIMAVSLGVCMIEKRLTLDIKTKGHHHIKALEPDELKAWVNLIRASEKALGDKNIKPSIADLSQKNLYFTSIVASRDIKIGEKISRDMLDAKRPGHGISPLYMDQMIGHVLNRKIMKDEAILWSDWGRFQ